ncbi:hypothetical protein [Leucobacter ruminantium]|uniref:Uncharacterized protein n=1 Tax=Leucobacter ruminantium TaxID=1289170 RepID=A0A939RYI5_9MICO|nr:hypothetical protein [Leucobacter ruminantium]MBO1804474.1 hypothetical protein [Leucobacter ruminantium]
MHPSHPHHHAPGSSPPYVGAPEPAPTPDAAAATTASSHELFAQGDPSLRDRESQVTAGEAESAEQDQAGKDKKDKKKPSRRIYITWERPSDIALKVGTYVMGRGAYELAQLHRWVRGEIAQGARLARHRVRQGVATAKLRRSDPTVAPDLDPDHASGRERPAPTSTPDAAAPQPVPSPEPQPALFPESEVLPDPGSEQRGM